MSDADDALVGRLLSRREVLAMFGVAGAALVVGCSDDDPDPTPTGIGPTSTVEGASPSTAPATAASPAATGLPSCIVVPELMEGPYFLDDMLDRSDIRTEPSDGSTTPGDQLDLTIVVSRIGAEASCEPLPNAIVDVWHCDALGSYSGFVDNAQGFNTVGQTFLRGYQRTDDAGAARFTSVYPGWYPGRATHIHFKIRTDDGYEFTSQLFFDDALSDSVHSQGPYAPKGTSGRTQNSEDGIFQGSEDMLTLDVQRSGGVYTATFTIGLQMA